MAVETEAQIRARLKSEHPSLTKQVADDVLPLDAGEYNETIERWVQAEVARQSREDASSSRKTKITNDLASIDALLVKIAGGGSPTNAEMVQFVKVAAPFVAGLMLKERDAL